jgi:plastocyanin
LTLLIRSALCVLLALAFVASACSSDDLQVAMVGGQQFEPESLTVTAGETVTFVNEDAEQHTVTAYEDSIPDGAEYFASGGAADEQAAREDLDGALIAQGDSFEVTFEEPGTYEYFCIPHEQSGMRGTIEVEESS